MQMSNIHPTAVVESGAKLGKNVTIEAYAVVKGTVTLEDNVVIKSFAYIDGYTTIGEGTVIWPSASIGTKTQDLKFRGEKTYVNIGKNCEIREFVTINSSCQEGSVVKVGDRCLIMAYCHVAHNCEIGNQVIMSNGAMLAGHVIVEDYAIIGGMTPIHQFCCIGRNAMVGGLSRVSHDIPPYTIGAGSPYKVGGINLIGLKRKGFSLEERKAIHQAFKLTYRSDLSLADALEAIERQVPMNEHVAHWLSFCRHSKRGLIGLRNTEVSLQEEEIDELEEVLKEKV
jgi:UDP-N-acetylglucosamine acyltransferase